MNRRLTFALGFAALLAACDRDVTLTPEQDAREACAKAHPAVKGDYVAWTDCLNRVDDKYVKPNNPDVDLVAKLEITRTTLARDVDIGEITPADYLTQLHSMETQIHVEEHNRIIERAHSTWGISHGLDPANRDTSPLPVIPPG